MWKKRGVFLPERDTQKMENRKENMIKLGDPPWRLNFQLMEDGEGKRDRKELQRKERNEHYYSNL